MRFGERIDDVILADTGWSDLAIFAISSSAFSRPIPGADS
jgi:hypothetical protein